MEAQESQTSSSCDIGPHARTFLHLLKLSYFLLRYSLSFLLTKKVLQSESAPFPCRGARLACPHMGVRKLFKRSLVCQPATANRVIVS